MRIRKLWILVAFLLLMLQSITVSYDPRSNDPAANDPVVEENMILSAETLTLRPNADVWSNLTRSSGSFNHDMVDDNPTHDSDGTTVSHIGPPATWDRYTLLDHTDQIGPITSLVVYYYAKETGAGSTGYRGHGIADSTAETSSGALDLTASYAEYSVTYATKPSGGAWTWDEVDNAEVLIAVYGSPVPSMTGWCTQVYVVVNYIAGIAYQKNIPESLSVNDTAFETEGGRPLQWFTNGLATFFLPVEWDPAAQFGYDAFFIFMGLIMIPVSAMYLVRGGRKDLDMDKLFLALVVFALGVGFLIGGIVP